jgi:peptidoglycan L-alanyl-D-glutamate endopeptidase CwlK
LLLLAVALYLLLACLISWMVLFPAGRATVLGALAAASARLQQRWQALARDGSGKLRALGNAPRGALGNAGDFVKRHALVCAGAGLLLTVPPLVAVFSGSGTYWQGFDDAAPEANPQIAALLEGEQLAPPPPLPPLAFTTEEVRQERPMIDTASRDWQALTPDYRQRLLLVFRMMKERYGYEMVLLEGYRSPERQNVLASMGSSVTNAAAFQSWHQYGLAADCAFLRNGRIVITEKDPWAMRGYTLYGELAESVGLTWGGRWKMMDFGHTELRLPGVMRRR